MGKNIFKLFILSMFAWIILGCGGPKHTTTYGEW